MDLEHGKTTIIKNIIDIFKESKKTICLCAPTGRAAKRMTESTGEEAKTIHRLLEIMKLEQKDIWESVDSPVTEVKADLVIIDEMSMVDVFLMNHLLKGISKNTKLVLVGDIDQLPSVGPREYIKRFNQFKKNTNGYIKPNIQASTRKPNNCKCTQNKPRCRGWRPRQPCAT